MKKHIILLGAILSSGIAYSQVGINTEKPKATLDVMASPADTSKTDGFIAPRLTGDELKAKDGLYTALQTGAIIYATAAASPTTVKTANVTAAGYYYFDGSVWQKISGGGASNDINIYKDDGTLTTNRIVTMDGKSLSFTGVGNVGIGASANANDRLLVEGDSRINGKLVVGSLTPNLKNAALSVRNIDAAEPIMRLTGTDGLRKVTVADNGYFGIVINDVTVPTQRLDVDGNVRFRNVPNQATITTTDRVMLLESDGTGKKISIATLKSEVDTNTNIYGNDGMLSANRIVNTNGNNLSFIGAGNVGIGTTNAPANKLEVNPGTVSTDVSGVRLSNVTAAPYLGTNAQGDIIRVAAPAATPMNVTPEITGSYTASPGDDIILLNPNTGGTILTLPTSGVPIGKKYYVSNKGDGNFDTSISPAAREGSHTILQAANAAVYVYIGGTGAGSYSRMSGY